jgi:acyl carrier protein
MATTIGPNKPMSAYLERVIATIVYSTGMPGDMLDEDSALMNDCGMDSLDVSELALVVEEEFDVEVSDATLESWSTIGDICDFLHSSLGEPEDE